MGIIRQIRRLVNLQDVFEDSYVGQAGKVLTVADTMDGVEFKDISNLQLYDGVDTTGNIKSLDPSVYLGQIWWSNDEKIEYHAVQSVLTSNFLWQPVGLIYNPALDTFKLPPTEDGQTQDIGQEQFIVCRNISGTNFNATQPGVFVLVGVDGTDPLIKEAVPAINTDLSEGRVFGVNTTSANAGEVFKLLISGDLNDADTSAFVDGEVLYVSDTTPGGLTNVKPTTKAFAVAYVTKSDAIDGKLYVSSARAVSDEAILIPAGSDRIFLTAEETDAGDPAGAGTFYLTKRNMAGTGDTTEVVVVPDSSIVGLAKDHVSAVFTGGFTTQPGNYQFGIDYEITPGQSTETLYLELYLANGDGTVVDAGTGLPNGDLGVPPILTADSGVLNTPNNTRSQVLFDATLTTTITASAGQRLRYHILCGKNTNAGPDKTFTIYFGETAETFAVVPQQLFLDDLGDVELVGQTENDLLYYDGTKWVNKPPADVPTGRMEYKGAWNQGAYDEDDVVVDFPWTMIANKATSDRPAPQPSGNPYFTLTDPFPNVVNSQNAVIHSGSKFTFNTGGWVREVRVWVPELTDDTNYRIVTVDITNPATPIYSEINDPLLIENDWTTVALGDRLILPGSEFLIYVDALNSGSDTQVIGGWRRDANSNSAGPAAEGWNTRNNNQVVRIDKTDLDTVDRSSELLGVIPGSTIEIIETATPGNNLTYDVTGSPIDQGTYVEYPVNLVGSNGSIGTGDTCTITITVPIPSPTKYIESVNYWVSNQQPGFGLVEGYFAVDGVTQSRPLDAFGVDIEFQPAYVSPDWDYVAVAGEGGSGGGGTDPGGGTSIVYTITQAAHGFAVGDIISLQTGGDYVKASALDDTKVADGVVVQVVDANEFKFQDIGEAPWDKSTLTPGNAYYLDVADGEVTGTEPLNYRQPVFIAKTSSTILINIEPMFVFGDPANTEPTGFEAINEGNGIGWRLVGRNAANYGNVGLNAVDGSTSTGASSTRGALGEASVAFGEDNEISGNYSAGFGQQNTVSQDYAGALGLNNTVGGVYGFTIGTLNVVNGIGAMAIGAQNQASAIGAFASGQESQAVGTHSAAIGNGAYTYTPSGVALGKWNKGALNDQLLAIGNGTDSLNRKDALVVRTDNTAVMPETDEATIDGADGRVLTTKEWAVNGGLRETNDFPTNSARKYEVLTQAEYDGIVTKDPNTLYFII